ncbi:hypothetical protein Tco_1384742 [Tanacetum coccineum]
MTKTNHKKGVKFDCAINKKQAFPRLLKQKLCSAPIHGLNLREAKISRIKTANASNKGAVVFSSKNLEALSERTRTTKGSDFALLITIWLESPKHNLESSDQKQRNLENIKKRGCSDGYHLEHLKRFIEQVHNTFHVSNLKKCYLDDPLVVPLEGLQVDDKIHFVEEPVEIMDHEVKQLSEAASPPLACSDGNPRIGGVLSL